ncbi:MAG: MBL fold metallo-hydrolase [Candidatus Levybacteria bacterium]|nr:MBL fold metallo-hydrolase [Candidatus Levybacteria bacterium]
MDVVLLDKNSIKVKGKNASLVVDPHVKTPKTNADAVIFLESFKEGYDASRVDEHRVVLEGQGEYEVGGIKIHGQKSDGKYVYSFHFDNINILLGKISALDKSLQESQDYQILILNVDSEINQSLITSFEANLLILYGEGASKENIKTLGKTESESLKKFSVVREKLPTELQVVILG